MKDIINNDPTLKYFVYDAKIDWFNKHHINLRTTAILIALAYYIERIKSN